MSSLSSQDVSNIAADASVSNIFFIVSVGFLEIEHKAHSVATRSFIHVEAGGEIIGFGIDAHAVARPCRYIVHLETETKIVETDFPAKFLIEAVTEDKVAELHVVGMFDGSVTDLAYRDVASVLCRHPAVGGNLIAIPVAEKVAGEGGVAESTLVAGSSGCVA